MLLPLTPSRSTDGPKGSQSNEASVLTPRISFFTAKTHRDSQVNREGARREGGLAIYDLKDSGDIENDADVIILMWPEQNDMEYSKAVDGQGSYIRLKYNIAKNREGERDVKGNFKFYNHKGLFV